jgi:hypothetical protein
MITHVYTLNTTNQLVDINDTYTSFTTMYSVTCDNMQDEFNYAIASQEMLDNKKIYFKKAIGYIEDSFTNNTGKYDNWYLILKTTKDTPCKVMLEITELESRQQPSLSPPAPPPATPPSSPSKRRLQPLQQQPLQQQPLQQQPRRQPHQQPQVKGNQHLSPIYEEYSDNDEYDDEEEEEEEDKQQQSAPIPTKNNWWWYIAVGITMLIVVIFGLWWTDKMHLIPFYNYFTRNTPVVETSHLLQHIKDKVDVQTPLEIVVPPLEVIVPSPPIVAEPPPHIVVEPPTASEVIVDTTPTQPVLVQPTTQLDTNFINEMRELKLNF